MEGIGSAFNIGKGSSAAASKSLFEDNSRLYLSLFLTQLKNQDPTAPFDTAQMTEQLAQLNSSEQLIDINSNLETLIATNNSSQASSLATFINKDVKYLSDEVYSDGSSLNEITYNLDKSYSKTTIEIRDEAGKLINKTEGEAIKGQHSIFWDGSSSEGLPVVPGNYNVRIFGENTNGTFDDISTMVSGTVTGVDFSRSSEPILTIGAGDGRKDIELKNVAAVSDLNNLVSNNI